MPRKHKKKKGARPDQNGSDSGGSDTEAPRDPYDPYAAPAPRQGKKKKDKSASQSTAETPSASSPGTVGDKTTASLTSPVTSATATATATATAEDLNSVPVEVSVERGGGGKTGNTGSQHSPASQIDSDIFPRLRISAALAEVTGLFEGCRAMLRVGSWAGAPATVLVCTVDAKRKDSKREKKRKEDSKKQEGDATHRDADAATASNRVEISRLTAEALALPVDLGTSAALLHPFFEERTANRLHLEVPEAMVATLRHAAGGSGGSGSSSTQTAFDLPRMLAYILQQGHFFPGDMRVVSVFGTRHRVKVVEVLELENSKGAEDATSSGAPPVAALFTGRNGRVTISAAHRVLPDAERKRAGTKRDASQKAVPAKPSQPEQDDADALAQDLAGLQIDDTKSPVKAQTETEAEPHAEQSPERSQAPAAVAVAQAQSGYAQVGGLKRIVSRRPCSSQRSTSATG